MAISRKVAVIGGGFVGNTMLAALAEKRIEVIKLDELKREANGYLDMEPFEITRLPELPTLGNSYEWKCKGIHEYRKNNINEWVCQCGRKL